MLWIRHSFSIQIWGTFSESCTCNNFKRPAACSSRQRSDCILSSSHEHQCIYWVRECISNWCRKSGRFGQQDQYISCGVRCQARIASCFVSIAVDEHGRCYNCIDEEKFLLFQLIILLLLILLLLLLPPVAIIMWVKLSKWFYALSYWNLVLSYWNQYERKCSFVSNLSYRKPRFWCADLLGACRLVFIKSFLILVHRVYFIT